VNAVYLAASCMQGLTSRVVLGEGGADFDRLQSVSACAPTARAKRWH